MKILAKTKHHYDGSEEYHNRLPISSQVERLGDYIAKKPKTKFMDVCSAKYFNNGYKIYINIMYQVPLELRKQMRKYRKEFQGKEEDIYVQKIFIGIAPYKDYKGNEVIRVLITLCDDNKETLGFIRFDRIDRESLPACKKEIRDFIVEKIEERYHAYDVMI